MKKMESEHVGVYIVLFCGVVWGLGGVATQILLNSSDITAGWLVVARMFIAGAGIIIYKICVMGKEVLKIFGNKKDFCLFLIFMFAGVMMMQYSYSSAIAASNAATATVLQYTYPVFILIYTAISQRQRPKLFETLTVSFVFIGIFLTATHGSFHALQISSEAFIWGILSALTFVVYTVYPKELYKKYDSSLLLGFAMFLGSIFIFFATECYKTRITVTFRTIVLTLFIMLFGCMIPLSIYSKGVALLGNVKASLFVTVEPLTCAVISAVLGLSEFRIIDIAGYAFILIPVEITAVRSVKSL